MKPGDSATINNSISHVNNEQIEPLGSKGMLVAVRIRPLSKKEEDSGHRSCCSVLNNQIVAIRKGGLAGSYLKSQQGR